MKRKITLLLLAAGSLLTMNSQIVLTEDFTSPFSFGTTTAGWLFQNNSSPLGTTDWFQGSGAVFPAFNGGANDYIGANFNNTGSVTPGSISNWLISPTVNLANGDVIEFATRTLNNIPDRLGLYISAGTGTNVGALGNATAVGSFTNIMTINSGLTANGYPIVWTVYSTTITGLAAPTVGRFAFRYDVTNAGNAGANSNYIGIDAVKYMLPCAQPTLVVAQTVPGVCSGNTVGLQVTTSGIVTAASYTWSTGQNGTSIVVTPTASGIYQVSGTSTAGCIGTQTAAVSVTTTPNVQVPSFTVCSAPPTTATITATGATSYSWNTGSTSNSITVTPASTTVYTVTGYALGGVCPSTPQTATVTVGSQLSMMINSTHTTLCSGLTATLSAVSAATTYSWSSGQTVPTITVNPTTTTTYSVGGISGTFPAVCAGGNSITITVIPSPTLNVTISPTTICSESDFTVTTAGAVTYTYILGPGPGSTQNPIPLTAVQVNSVTVGSFIVGGTAANGCVSAGTVTLSINPNPTVNATSSSPTVCVNSTVTLTGSGATSYAWSGASTATTGAVTYSSNAAGTKNFTVTGSDAIGCSASATLAVNVVTCTASGINGVDASEGLAVFPNPFSNELVISDFDGTVTVYNALGKVVINQAVSASETINTSELPKGAYILKAHTKDGEAVKTIKLLKN